MPRTQMTQAILCPNPSMMTLHGTKTYVVSAPGSESVVLVDPGPTGYPEHFQAMQEVVGNREIELILLTHHHADHSGAAPHWSKETGAPVRAFRPELCIGAAPLKHEERILAADAVINVIHTPGHTSDSVCFFLAADGDFGSVLTGDTILGKGTTMLDYPDGSLIEYLASLDALGAVESEGPIKALPAHGPELPNLEAAVEEYLEHRHQRLTQLEGFLEENSLDLDQLDGQEPFIAEKLYGVSKTSAGTMGHHITVQMVQAMAAYLRQHAS